MQCNVYDDSVLIHITRHGVPCLVRFSDLREGDVVSDKGNDFTVGSDAHFCGDASYAGWLVYDQDGNDHYPEDFGAELLEPDDDNEGD